MRHVAEHLTSYEGYWPFQLSDSMRPFILVHYLLTYVDLDGGVVVYLDT